MSDNTISTSEVAAVLPMIGAGNGWPSKARIVSLIGSREGGDWFTSGDVGEWLGISDGRARVLLRALELERVLLRDGGAGERVFWCEVNPDIGQWRGVPWTVPARVVRQRLAWHREQVASGTLGRLIARPMYARCQSVIARLIARDDGAKPTPKPPSEGGLGTPHRAPIGARSQRRLRAVQGRAMSGGRGAKKGSLVFGGDKRVVFGPGDEQQQRVDTKDLNRACAMLAARAIPKGDKKPYLAKSKVAEVAQLIEAHGAESVCDAIKAVDRDMVPGMLDRVTLLLATPDDLPDADAQQREEHRRRILERKAGIERLIAIHEAEDAEVPEETLLELLECENGLARLDEQGAA